MQKQQHVEDVEDLLEAHQKRIEALLACSEQRVITAVLQALEKSSNTHTISAARAKQQGPQHLCPTHVSLVGRDPLGGTLATASDPATEASLTDGQSGSSEDVTGKKAISQDTSAYSSQGPNSTVDVLKKFSKRREWRTSGSDSSDLQRSQTVQQIEGQIRAVQGQIHRDSGIKTKNPIKSLLRDFSGLSYGSIPRRLVSNRKFHNAVSSLILLNTLVIGIQTEWQAMHVGEPEPSYFHYAETCFTVLFAIELLMRLHVSKMEFFTGNAWRWNVFDFFIVGASVVETVLKLTVLNLSKGFGLMTLRALRVFRLVRTIRAVRVMHGFRELRLVVHGIMTSLASMIWLLVVLGFFMFMAAVYITQNVTDFLTIQMYYEEHENVHKDLVTLVQKHWGNMPLAFYSLYKSISAGENWGMLALPLFKISPSAAILFVAFVSFAIFAILNVVTGIFVDNARKASKNDAQFCIMEETSERQKQINEVRMVFQGADGNDNGELTFEEFDDHIVKNPNVLAYMRLLELDFTQIGSRKLFNVLDVDARGTVDLNEFVVGCTKLKGNAKAIDLALLQHDIKKQTNEYIDLRECITEILQLLSSGVQEQQDVLSGLDLKEEGVVPSWYGQSDPNDRIQATTVLRI